jgi:osmotically-inducible protein OsmY
MKRSLIPAVVRVLVAAPIFFAIAAGWAAAADAPDAWLTMKTKIALMTTEGLSTSDLNVDTVQGVVTLHGKVPTQSEKAKAEAEARRVDGVKDVKNLLQVVPDSTRKVVERADDQIKDAVVAAFKASKRVNDSGVTVQSVNKGVVLLAGRTGSLESHLEAVQVANAVAGVRRVASEVQVTAGTE